MLSTSMSYALSTDRDQPADIEADDIEFDFKNGTRTYLDNVLVVQGTLRLKADKVVANYSGSELDNATAWGSLARFKQRPDGKKDDVEGWAKKIVVNQKANTLTLIGKAAIKQGADTARGETIVYNMATDTLSLKGGAKVGSSGKTGDAKPKRKLADPFEEDGRSQGPELAAAKTTNDDADSDEETQNVEEKQTIEPVKAGRSRLIIRPK